MVLEENTALAAKNLLVNCAGLEPGESLLIVNEQAALGWYASPVCEVLAQIARQLRVAVRVVEVGKPTNGKDPELTAQMAQHDCTLFLARIGDQDRFEARARTKVVMCYIRDEEMLGSPFGCVDYRATVAMKGALDRVLDEAPVIRLRCPLGTDCRVEKPPGVRKLTEDVNVLRFPLGVVSPIDAGSLNGQVVLTNFLTPTGSRVYDPPTVRIDAPVIARVNAGRIEGFSGDIADVRRIEAHYERVARTFDIDAYVVHSWHVGMHPGLLYREDPASDPDRWSNTMFNHPRYAHFHTCGNYAPGEICWMVKDPCVEAHGHSLWESGRLQPEHTAPTQAVLHAWPELEALYL